jgi:hypothetical protein
MGVGDPRRMRALESSERWKLVRRDQVCKHEARTEVHRLSCQDRVSGVKKKPRQEVSHIFYTFSESAAIAVSLISVISSKGYWWWCWCFGVSVCLSDERDALGIKTLSSVPLSHYNPANRMQTTHLIPHRKAFTPHCRLAASKGLGQRYGAVLSQQAQTLAAMCSLSHLHKQTTGTNCSPQPTNIELFRGFGPTVQWHGPLFRSAPQIATQLVERKQTVHQKRATVGSRAEKIDGRYTKGRIVARGRGCESIYREELTSRSSSWYAGHQE